VLQAGFDPVPCAEAGHLINKGFLMIDIFIKTHFSGGHHLRDYPGTCELPHGHNWKVKVCVRAVKLDELGMGIDFKVLKKHVNRVIDDLDHCNLNEHPAFQKKNPSSEHIAMYIFNQLRDELQTDRYSLYSVQVRETDSSGVLYYGD
jgi:6-pyruvoyltetrahydropterin/6-carboxytetrahydropterin synthase